MSVDSIRGLTFFLKNKIRFSDYMRDRILKHDNFKKTYVSYNMESAVNFSENTNVRTAIKHNAWFRHT